VIHNFIAIRKAIHTTMKEGNISNFQRQICTANHISINIYKSSLSADM